MIEGVLRRERWVVVGGVIAVAGLAWLDLWRRARGVMDMAMPDMEPWSAAELGAIALMWAVMMIAMMLPSAVPMLSLFAGTERARRPGTVIAFGAGYVIVWIGFSVAAAILQARLQEQMLLSPALATTSPWLGAGLLAIAGVYQLTRSRTRASSGAALRLVSC